MSGKNGAMDAEDRATSMWAFWVVLKAISTIALIGCIHALGGWPGVIFFMLGYGVAMLITFLSLNRMLGGDDVEQEDA